MGTIISLDIGGLSVASAQNHRGPDHGLLFQPSDRQRFRSEQIDYDVLDRDKSELADIEVGFARPLSSIVPRLELLGYTLKTAEVAYKRVAAACVEERKAYREHGYDIPLDVMPFEEFRQFISRVPITELDDTFDDGRDDDSDRRIMGRFTDEAFKARLPRYETMLERLPWSERSYFGALIEFLHPYSLLRLLAENEGNLGTPVEWQYGPLIDAGWAEESEFVAGPHRTQTYLIATEGSSDTHILQRAFQILRPEIADFFRFIDVSERHPFSGAGSLVKFAEGLAKIDVHNRIIFLLDNDAEGRGAFEKIGNLTLPINMRAMMLPPMKTFEAFPTVGPDGETLADINGHAAAIECYVDLYADGLPPPLVRWTNYKEDVDAYQGALQQKDRYSRAFFDKAGRGVGYDMSKLSDALEAITRVCTTIAVDLLEKGGEK